MVRKKLVKKYAQAPHEVWFQVDLRNEADTIITSMERLRQSQSTFDAVSINIPLNTRASWDDNPRELVALRDALALQEHLIHFHVQGGKKADRYYDMQYSELNLLTLALAIPPQTQTLSLAGIDLENAMELIYVLKTCCFLTRVFLQDCRIDTDLGSLCRALGGMPQLEASFDISSKKARGKADQFRHLHQQRQSQGRISFQKLKTTTTKWHSAGSCGFLEFERTNSPNPQGQQHDNEITFPQENKEIQLQRVALGGSSFANIAELIPEMSHIELLTFFQVPVTYFPRSLSSGFRMLLLALTQSPFLKRLSFHCHPPSSYQSCCHRYHRSAFQKILEEPAVKQVMMHHDTLENIDLPRCICRRCSCEEQQIELPLQAKFFLARNRLVRSLETATAQELRNLLRLAHLADISLASWFSLFRTNPTILLAAQSFY